MMMMFWGMRAGEKELISDIDRLSNVKQPKAYKVHSMNFSGVLKLLFIFLN